MRKTLFFSLLLIAACASKERRPASLVSVNGVIELQQALDAGAAPTVAYLRKQTTAKSYDGLNGRDPAAQLPAGLLAERVAQPVSKEKRMQTQFLRKYRAWTPERRVARAGQLIADFHCGNAIEAQSLGMILELDFPEEKARASSQDLHEKV